MRAFWWFKENSIAGMARPGFNKAHWFDLPFDEAIVLSWLGQYSSGRIPLDSFHRHLETYAPKVFKFYELDHEAGSRALQIFNESAGFMEALERLNERTHIFSSCEMVGACVQVEINPDRVRSEAEALKSHGIRRIVSLTELHHNRDLLETDFELHHIGIEDLGAPTSEQVQVLAEILEKSRSQGEKVAVHCLAGIGRTSTMLMAAHLHLGEEFESLRERLAKQNPSFVYAGPQGEFIERFRRKAD